MIFKTTTLAGLLALNSLGTSLAEAKSMPPADELITLSKELVSLRGQVESLQRALDGKRLAVKNKVNSLAQNEADLSTEIQRQELKMTSLRQKIATYRQSTQGQQIRDEALTTLLLESLASLRASIADSLPFRQKDRLKAVDDMVTRLKQGDAASMLLPKVWNLFEDELRLVKETAIHRQVIELKGKEHLVEVLRVGMVMMFFRTEAGSYGLTRFKDHGYAFELTSDPKEVHALSELFAAVRQSQRVGLFSFPNTLSEKEVMF